MAKVKTLKAMQALSDIMANDNEYAWSWHCNLAMMAVDVGANHKNANIRVSDFMRTAFGVDTSKLKEYKQIMESYDDSRKMD